MSPDSAAVLSGPREPVFRTANVRDAELTNREETEKGKASWNKFIDGSLIEWGRDPTVLEDEGFIPPSLEVVRLACQVAVDFRDERLPAPTRVVPDGEGGICFERIEGSMSVSLRIYADRTGELLVFDDCRLSDRRRLLASPHYSRFLTTGQ